MNIEILGTESLGVRALCCFVETENQKILIDPGLALGYVRHGLLPHPFQVAVDERIQRRIVKRWSEATDIVISHFHGDHVPLTDANPYQLNINRVTGLNTKVRISTKSFSHLYGIEKRRAQSLSFALGSELVEAEGTEHGVITFSNHVFHGDKNEGTGTVMMTRIEEDRVFVHASDIQLLSDEAISVILLWEPDIVLAGGPPLYLTRRLSDSQLKRAWHNARLLSEESGVLILDHHLMRSFKGTRWLKRLSSKAGGKVLCGADFMKRPRMLLEAGRRRLYEDMPVPEGWHEAYSKGEASPDEYWKQAKELYEHMELDD